MERNTRYETFLDEDENTELVNTRTIFVPLKKFEIAYSVRKQTDFPVVQEMVLRLIRTLGGEVMTQVVSGFLNFSDQELQVVVRPLLEQGLLERYENKLVLTAAGGRLFLTDSEIPSISEAEARAGVFYVDSHSCLPIARGDQGRVTMGGKYSSIIPDCLPVNGTHRSDYSFYLKEQFSRYFGHYMQNTNDLDNYRSDKLSLHKVDYCRISEDLVLSVDIDTRIKVNGVSETRVLPFDSLEPKTEERASLRKQLIDAITVTPSIKNLAKDDVRLIRHLFGDDFLSEAYGVYEVLNWNTLMKQISNGEGVLQSGASVIFGAADVLRNRNLITNLIHSELEENEYTKEEPLKVTWIRPGVESWGRSMRVFETLSELRREIKENKGGEVLFCLSENRDLEVKLQGRPEVKAYKARDHFEGFDDVKYFRTHTLPPNVEILLVGSRGGLVLSHSFYCNNSPIPAPIGVYFENIVEVVSYLEKHAVSKMRAFPRRNYSNNRK